MNTPIALKAPANAGLGLKDTSRNAVLAALDVTLADEYLLYTKTRNFHWNIEGPRFSELHKFFESQYEALNVSIDDVAERSRALDGRSLGSMREFLSMTRLQESTARGLKADAMLAELLADHEAVVRSLRTDVDAASVGGDQGTADFLTGLMELHEKMAWMLRSFLK